MPLLSPKTPNEVKDYGVEWEDMLADGDSLSSIANIAVAPAGVTVQASQILGTITLVRLAAGTNGVSYTVTVRVTTLGGETLEAAIPVEVMDASAAQGLTL